ncbi:lipase family protein [Nocardia fluminea]|uniref:lipase family protein n=1 Tax=Nocardia fluminea TaxID=134984 RepID=UPI001FE6AF7F|nr:lipase family protein [Nocardia fluminea]
MLSSGHAISVPDWEGPEGALFTPRQTGYAALNGVPRCPEFRAARPARHAWRRYLRRPRHSLPAPSAGVAGRTLIRTKATATATTT